MFIQTVSDDNKVLGLNGDEVILELKNSKKAGQLWIKGEDRSGCYFTLKNNESSKVLTASSENSLKAKGNSKKKGIVFLGVSSTSQGSQRGPNSALRNSFFMSHLISLWLVRTCKFTSLYEP